jgi:hypothetical protein
MSHTSIPKNADGTITVIGTNGEHIQTVEAVVNGHTILIPVDALNQIPHVPLERTTPVHHSAVSNLWFHPATPIVIGLCVFIVGLGAYALARATTPPTIIQPSPPAPAPIIIPPVQPPASNQKCVFACF